jgi:small subunit ribosomal protein S8
MSSDPIADFLTTIRNASSAQHKYIEVQWSRTKEDIAKILRDLKLIANFLVNRDGAKPTIRLTLKYTPERKPVIQGLTRVSKPGVRKYIGYADIPRFYGNFGIAILSTPQGVLSGAEALKRKIGGELLCLVW